MSPVALETRQAEDYFEIHLDCLCCGAPLRPVTDNAPSPAGTRISGVYECSAARCAAGWKLDVHLKAHQRPRPPAKPDVSLSQRTAERPAGLPNPTGAQSGRDTIRDAVLAHLAANGPKTVKQISNELLFANTKRLTTLLRELDRERRVMPAGNKGWKIRPSTPIDIEAARARAADALYDSNL